MADPISTGGAMPQPNAPPEQNLAMGQDAPQAAAPAPNTTMPGTPAPTPTPAGQQINPTQQPQKPGNFFTNLSHAFMGAVLGGLAGTKQDVAQYHVDPDTQEMTPLYKDPQTGQLSPTRQDMHPRDQLAKIAHSALRGLAYTAAMGPAGLAVAAQHPQTVDLQKRTQAQESFEDQQKAMFNKVNNAHILLGNLETTKNLATSDLASNQRAADIGNNMMDAAVEGGNKVVGNANMSPADVAKFRQDHPEYLNYTPLITQATLATDENGQPVVDLKTGVQKVNLGYSMVDMKTPIKLTGMMINHLQSMGVPGAEHLNEGDKVNPTQFQALYYNGLNAYNAANRDSKNNEIVDTTDEKGNLTKNMVNKVTKEVTPLIDPETKQPLGSKVETETHTEFDPATQKNEDWLISKNNGKKITFLGENKTDMNSITNAVGDFSKTGEAYLQTVPIQLRQTVKSLASYGMKPADLGRSNSRLSLLEAAGQYNGQPLDLKTYQLRFNYLNDYQDPKGADGKQRGSGNTAIGHLDQLSQAGEALDSGNLQRLNQLAVQYGLETGAAPAAVYDSIAYKAAAEAATAAQGGVPNQSETDKLYSQLSSKMSPQQRNATIHAQYGLIVTPMQNMKVRFIENMGQTPESLGRPVVNADNEKILQKYGYGSSSIAGNPATGIPGLPPGATAARDANKNVVGYVLNGKYTALPSTPTAPTAGAK